MVESLGQQGVLRVVPPAELDAQIESQDKAQAEQAEEFRHDIQEVVRKAYLNEDYDEKLKLVMEKPKEKPKD